MKKVILILVLTLLFVAQGECRLFNETNKAQAASRPTSTNQIYTVFHLNYIDASELESTLENLLSDEDNVSVNKSTNSVIVGSSAQKIIKLKKIVKAMDVPPLQVQVEAKIIELKANNGDTANPSSLGMNWKVYNKNNSNDFAQQLTTGILTSGATSLGLYAQILSGNTEAYLSGLEKVIGYDLVASPWITALNHKEAEILIGAKYGYLTLLTTTTGTLQQVNYLEVGTKLKFTPHISDDGYIRMTIYPSVSEGQVTNGLPQENTTETKNEVLVKDGQSIVIGGLMKDYTTQTEIGIPFLSSIPLLGTLFRRTELVAEKREIMVIITPHIVTPEFLEAMSLNALALDARRTKWKEGAKLVH